MKGCGIPIPDKSPATIPTLTKMEEQQAAPPYIGTSLPDLAPYAHSDDAHTAQKQRQQNRDPHKPMLLGKRRKDEILMRYGRTQLRLEFPW
jgi:hypothetical protein